jgi:hypothetical protein
MSESTGDSTSLPAAITMARAEIRAALAMLEQVAGLQPTIDRESRCGSAWKRLSMLEAMAGDADAEQEAIARMKQRYDNAEALARQTKHPELFYPALNRMAAELIVAGKAETWGGFDPTHVAEIRESLLAKTRDDPDFWSVSGVTQLRMYETMARRSLAPSLESILDEYASLNERVRATWLWASVYDQARWVVPKYMERADTVEDAAACRLLVRLATYAGVRPITK